MAQCHVVEISSEDLSEVASSTPQNPLSQSEISPSKTREPLPQAALTNLRSTPEKEATVEQDARAWAQPIEKAQQIGA